MPTRPHASTEAVSPVVAVVLLVAITIVLTSLVLVLVGRVQGSKSDVAPVVVPSKDEANGRFVVVRADPFLPLSRLRIEMSADGYFAYNALASSATTPLPANTLVPLGSSGDVVSGDAIYFCATPAAHNVQVLVQDPVTNKLVASETFTDLAACT